MHYAYDTAALAKGTGNAVVKAGGKSWYFLTADYAFGTQLQNDTTKVVKAAGGKVARLGARAARRRATSRRSCSRRSRARREILGLANAGGDTINSIKAANEFGVTKTMKLAGLLMFINDVHSLGLKATQGMYLTDSWYWNRDAESRAWSRKFFDKFKRMPSSLQAADYSATLQYLTAVKAIGSDDPDKVLAQMKKTKINDIYAKGGWIRDDGSMIHDMYLMQVKSPDKSTEPWDYYNIVQTFKGEEAWTTKAESKCAALEVAAAHRRATSGASDPMQVFLGQLMLGLVNGSFYAMLSLGLAVIFGLLGIVNFAHGALYMLGAYVAFIGSTSSASTTGPR